ncbi:MAG: hypothetical protein HYV34_02420 [Candidatus Kerfeldbacteria bacterium]|nr:hypothetical protein [Candidatus Kerfeldbacteria bacterium]
MVLDVDTVGGWATGRAETLLEDQPFVIQKGMEGYVHVRCGKSVGAV